MKKKSSIFKRALAVLLCLSFLVTSVIVDPVSVQADPWLNYVNKCFKSMTPFARANTGLSSKDIIATAYLVGSDDMCDKSWLTGYHSHDLYAVEPGTKINGKTINSKYLPQDNGEYLKAIKEEYFVGNPRMTNAIYSKPEGFQGTMREGSYLLVFDYDEEWVTVYDDGFQMWSAENGLLGCMAGRDAYLETHPAGFYKIKRNLVWIDFGLKSNHPYKSSDEIPKKGTGTVTKLVPLLPVPNEEEKVYTKVYALPRGTTVNVVSTDLVPSEAEGSTAKYYKVSFNGGPNVQNNTVQYMRYKVPGVYYVDSRYLNFAQKNVKRPEEAVPGVITNVASDGTVYAYESNDTKSEQVGILTKSTKLWMFPEESDGSWTTVWFSGQRRYVQTKYIKKGTYTVKDISNLHLADIVDDQFVVKWNPGTNNEDFIVKIGIKKSGKIVKVLWSDQHYKESSLTVAREYIPDEHLIGVSVQANDKNGKKGKELNLGFFLPQVTSSKLKDKNFTVGKNSVELKLSFSSLQYSTDKNFKNAKTIEKPVKKDGKISSYERIKRIDGLKSGTTYYVRFRAYKKYKTKAGEKLLLGAWSDAIKIKTK